MPSQGAVVYNFNYDYGPILEYIGVGVGETMPSGMYGIRLDNNEVPTGWANARIVDPGATLWPRPIGPQGGTALQHEWVSSWPNKQGIWFGEDPLQYAFPGGGTAFGNAKRKDAVDLGGASFRGCYVLGVAATHSRAGLDRR